MRKIAMTGLICRRVVLAVLALSIGLAACSGEGGIDGPVLTSPRPGVIGGSDGLDGIVSGTLAFDQERECLLLQDPDNDRIRSPVVWPSGASWQQSPIGVILNDGQLVEPGMSVLGSGGYQTRAQVAGMAGAAVADAAAACAGATGEIAIFNMSAAIAISPGG